jgi:protein gp37
MGEGTAISWATHTFNSWWGCWKIAPECAHCYADSTAHRYVSQFGELWGRTGPRRFFGDHHWNEPRKWPA